MNHATKENPDVAEWQGDTLVYSSFNEYRTESPVEELTFEKCDPTADRFCYWCAIGGMTFALSPKAGQTCIATVEHALWAQNDIAKANGGWLGDAVYVIWQPKIHTVGVWERWQKKWSKRTAIN